MIIKRIRCTCGSNYFGTYTKLKDITSIYAMQVIHEIEVQWF